MYPAKPTAAAASEPVVEMAPPVTGIPISSPIHGGGAVAATQWSSGLCDCFDDCGLCCLTCCCPCITFGRIAEIVDRGATSCGAAGAIYTLLACFTTCHWIYSCTYRSKMRAQFGLPETPCCDCCVHFCCEQCALCQQYRHLKARGFDPDLGWDANAQKAAAAAHAAMYPPAAQGMGR